MIDRLYRGITAAVAPAVGLLLKARAAQGKEDPARTRERWGHGARPRPAGRLVWIHAASVGEATSVLPLVERLVAKTFVLVTTGTVTSAALLARRLPEGALHQFVPVDVPRAVERFLDHWRPDAAIWVESELWPNLVLGAAARHIPLVLVQGRMSERALAGWRRAPGLAKRILGAFRFILAQTAADGARFSALGAAHVRALGNLKFAAPALPADEADLAALRAAVGARPVWCAASTHDPEEALVGRVHAALASRHPRLLTILVPRHADRGAAIASALAATGLAVARRAAGEAIGPATGIYVADTMGELGLFYRLAPIVFVGGSLIPHGGQNPLEPARLGAGVLHGPSMENFVDAVAALEAAGASERVADEAALIAALDRLLGAPDVVATRGKAAAEVGQAGVEALDAVADALMPLVRGP